MSLLTDTVDAIFTEHCTDRVRLAAEAGTWPTALWAAVEAAGLPLALVDRGEHALGITVTEAFEIVRLAGAHAVPVPLAETMLATWLLARAGSAVQRGPVVVALPGCATPWGAQAAVLECRIDGLVRHEASTVGVSRRTPNLAREPRDALAFDGKGSVGACPVSPTALFAAMAALRTAQIAGAIDWITRATVDYANTRVQFGKPIGKFQAVQHSIAVLAEHAAAASAAADMAADGFADECNALTIAAAKTYASEAAGVAAGLAHQVHGAIGFSQAFGLHHRTRRLWSWRDEYGNEAHWAAHLGGHLAGRQRDDLWNEITRL